MSQPADDRQAAWPSPGPDTARYAHLAADPVRRANADDARLIAEALHLSVLPEGPDSNSIWRKISVAGRTQADELMVVSDMYDQEKRRRSIEIIAGVMATRKAAAKVHA